MLMVGAYSMGMFAVSYWLIDVRGWWKRTLFFRIVGLNAITIYLARPLFRFGNLNEMLFGRFAGWFPKSVSGVVLQATYVLVCWLFLLWLHRRRIYFKV